MESDILYHFKKETKRRIIDESISRCIQCVDKLTDVEIWYRPNGNVVSVGNLILHLCGNARQWILAGIFDQSDDRERQLEFDTQGPLDRSYLLQKLTDLGHDLDKAMDTLTHDQLAQVKTVQGYEESVVGILIHVIEHFSYHTGQIVYFTKTKKDVDMGFYADDDLNITE